MADTGGKSVDPSDTGFPRGLTGAVIPIPIFIVLFMVLNGLRSQAWGVQRVRC